MSIGDLFDFCLRDSSIGLLLGAIGKYYFEKG